MASGNWGLTEYYGPEKILDFIRERQEDPSILFVGSGLGLDFSGIISQIKKENHQCKIIFSDIHESIETTGKKFNHEDVDFIRLDVLRDLETKSSWDCVVAFGLFSPRALSSPHETWTESAMIAISNLIEITKKDGLIVASTREEDGHLFERILHSIDAQLPFKKNTDFSRETVYDKHQFRKLGLWKGGNLNEEYRAYLRKQIKRTNFYITKMCH